MKPNYSSSFDYPLTTFFPPFKVNFQCVAVAQAGLSSQFSCHKPQCTEVTKVSYSTLLPSVFFKHLFMVELIENI